MNNKLLKYLVITTFCCFSYNPLSYSQQIITDGNTDTKLSVQGAYTDVSTRTIKGNNAFNSFSRFNVETGNVVNLIVPTISQNLINLVHSERSFIDGTLNGLKNNQIGGNIFFVNPYGMTVGSQGVINVGSLTAVTPTIDFVNRFFDSPGIPNDSTITALMNGTMPINVSADIIIKGAINALGDVKLDAGSIITEGTMNAGGTASTKAFETQDVVNINGYYDSDNLEIVDGRIILKAANDVELAGTLNTEGNDNINAGDVTIFASNDVILNENSKILAYGNGASSNGGIVNILAGNKSSFLNNAIINTRGGDISGNGGNIELSANQIVEIDGGIFFANAVDGQAGSVLVDPVTLNLNSTFSDGVDLNFEAENNINILNGAIISSRNLLNATTGENVSGLSHINELSKGDSGNISFTSLEFNMAQDSNVLSFANNDYKTGSISIKTNSIDMDNAGVLIDATGGNVVIKNNNNYVFIIADAPKDDNYLRMHTSEVNKIFAENLQLGESDLMQLSTEQIIVTSDLDYTGNLALESIFYTYITNNANVNIDGDLTLLASEPWVNDINVLIDEDIVVNVAGNLRLDAPIVKMGNSSGILVDTIDILSSKKVFFETGANLIANDDIRFQINELSIDHTTPDTRILSTNGAAIFSPYAKQNIYLGDYGLLSPESALKINASKIYIGNHPDTNDFTNEIYINKDYNLVNETDLVLTATNNIFGSKRSLGTNGNISLIAQNGQIGYENQYVIVNEGNTKSLTASANGNIYLKESDGDMRINTIQSNTGDIYISSGSGGIINASENNDINIKGNNLFFKEIIPEAEYFFIGISANGSPAENRDGSMDYFFNEIKAVGENWAKIPQSNVTILDNSQRDVYKSDILGMVENYSNRMDGDDTLFICYHGHGGSTDDRVPIDEVPGSKALDSKDEYIASVVRPGKSYSYHYSIIDEEFASALKDADGLVVFVSAQCQGGMFGGNADIDAVAEANGFKYFGMMGAKEGLYGWRRNFLGSDGHVYALSDIYQDLDISINFELDPVRWTDNAEGTEWFYVEIPQAINPDGNVYLDEWFLATKGGLDTYWVKSEGVVYLEQYQQFTNLSADEIKENPIIVKNWKPVIDTANVSSVGTSSRALTINLIGNVSANATGDVYLTQNTGNLRIDNIISTSGTVNINNTSGQTYINKISGVNVFVHNTANTSSSNIVINPSGVINASGGGNSLILNTEKGSFINNSGANALKANTGRWLVYTDNPSNTYENNLVFSKQYNKTFKLSTPSTINAGNHILYSIAPILTVTAENQSRVYGFDNPVFTYTVTGFIDGDGFGNNITGDADLFSLATRTSAPGSYTITTTQDSLASLLGYGFNFIDGTLDVIPATPQNSSIVQRAVNRRVSSITNTVLGNTEPNNPNTGSHIPQVGLFVPQDQKKKDDPIIDSTQLLNAILDRKQ